MESLVAFLNCGIYYDDYVKGRVDFIVLNFSDIKLKIIPFFMKYPIWGVKTLDFADFCRLAEIIETKNHLTQTGLDEIKLIKAGMNRGRIN